VKNINLFNKNDYKEEKTWLSEALRHPRINHSLFLFLQLALHKDNQVFAAFFLKELDKSP
jgi:hypothetical protein